MTVRECMDFALQLLNQYSIVGVEVPLSYNDQADTENRMINLINDAQMQIATTVKPLNTYIDVDIPELKRNEKEDDIVVEMPDDFYTLGQITFKPLHGIHRIMIDAAYYKMLGDDKLVFHNRPAGTYHIEYHRYPERLDPYMRGEELENTYLDNTPDTHEIIPYYIGAMIALDENPKTYYALYNVWETRLARLGYKPPHAENTHVQDVYGFDHFRGLW